MKKLGYILSSFMAMVLAVVGCSNTNTNNVDLKANHHIDIIDMEFDQDYAKFHVDVKMDDSIASFLIEQDTLLEFKAAEIVDGHGYNPATQPRMVNYENILAREIADLNLKVHVIVDLTLDETSVATEKKAVTRLKDMFALQNMKISFMHDGSISETYDATDYVLGNYFKPEHGDKYLYRGIIEKLEEISSHPHYYDYSDSDSTKLHSEQDILIIFSDGKTYSNRKPIDPEHFSLQKQLISISGSIYDIPVYYINMASVDRDENHVIQLLCETSGGKYLSSYKQGEVTEEILGLFDKKYANYRFYFTNPSQKTYRGDNCQLQLQCIQNGNVIASDYISYSAGSIYNPIIVNGSGTTQVLLQGLILGLIVILLIFIIFQFIVPYINYLIFRKKHVTAYTGAGMSYNGFPIEQSCYLCKAPFVEGEKIVAKCRHVMHEECWEENEYHCPEYGRNCKHGSHYYNKHRLLDRRNAPFYYKWIIAGTFAALGAWLCLTLYTELRPDNHMALIQMVTEIYDEESIESAELYVQRYDQHLYYMPMFGLSIGFFITLTLSTLLCRSRHLWERLLIVLGKSVVGGFLCSLSFTLICILYIVMQIKEDYLIIDCIPWIMSSFIIAITVAFGTDIRLKRALGGAAISIIFGLGSMYLWSYAYNIPFDTRVFILFSYMIYCIGFSLSIAVTSPRSERYFLRVEGPIKTMDIAIYKWMQSSFIKKRVIIGKSVNCDLQMTWDIISDIAPEQAEVRMSNGYPYLIALEDGITVGKNKKALKQGEKKRLYHNSKFTIGKTLFTYLEKDI